MTLLMGWEQALSPETTQRLSKLLISSESAQSISTVMILLINILVLVVLKILELVENKDLMDCQVI